MSKIKLNKTRADSNQIRSAFEFYYSNKFFMKWMNRFTFDGLNYQQIHFIMKKFWADGTIACSRPVGIPSGLMENMKEDKVIFTPYSVDGLYNIYDFPIKVLAINLRGVSFVNPNPLEVDKDIVIGFCQRNHKSVYSTIETKIHEIVDIEMVKRIALKCQKMPWLFTTTPENKNAIDKLIKDLESDDPTLLTTLLDSELGKGFVSGAPYILDKLEQQRQKIEDDINTILGVNNVGIAEKKEHLIVDEVNANNQSVSESADDYLTMIRDFFDRIDKVFGFKVPVNLAHKPINIEYEEEENTNE